MSTKISPKDVVKAIRADEKRQIRKSNVTFRFDGDLIARFRKTCEDQDVSMTSVLERYMKNFLGED